MKLKINKIEGKTSRKGSKQNNVYTLFEEPKKNFFLALSDTGKQVTIWNVYNDWSKIGIMTKETRRMSYSSDFEII